jgi:hypothetical protein
VSGARGVTHIETDETTEPVGPGGLAFSLRPQQMRTWRLLLDDLPPSVYCSAKTNSRGCTPAMSWSGVPSAGAGSGFVLRATEVLDGVPGMLFYGLAGPAAQPFQGGFLCVQSPLRRTAAVLSGGLPPCGGLLAFDFNAHAASGADPGLTAGTDVHCQFWSRDGKDPFGLSLTDAVAFTLGP